MIIQWGDLRGSFPVINLKYVNAMLRYEMVVILFRHRLRVAKVDTTNFSNMISWLSNNNNEIDVLVTTSNSSF